MIAAGAHALVPPAWSLDLGLLIADDVAFAGNAAERARAAASPSGHAKSAGAIHRPVLRLTLRGRAGKYDGCRHSSH
jgi:hypothetical protein